MAGSDSDISLMTESEEGEEETREERARPGDDKDFFEDQATQWAEVCAGEGAGGSCRSALPTRRRWPGCWG